MHKNLEFTSYLLFKKIFSPKTIYKRIKGGSVIKVRSLFQQNQKMIDTMVEEGKIRDSEIERAFRVVKRHQFLQGIVSPEDAYKDQAIMIKGEISSSSQPYVMAMMLEALDLKRGLKVLEIGTASGYNAALISEIVGRNDLVYTIELEADLAERAGHILREAGYPGVTVIAGDGRKGYPIAAPYDRIIVTAEAQSIYPALIRQLTLKGIMIIPFNFYNLLTITVKLYSLGNEKYRGSLVGFPVNFVPVRGIDVENVHTERKIEKRIYLHYNHLIEYLLLQDLELSNMEIIGLVLLMFIWYTEDRLKKPQDYKLLVDFLEEGW